MSEAKVLTRKGELTDELTEVIKENFRGVDIEYSQVYYLDYAVNEYTGKVSLTEKEKFFKGSQMDMNLKNFKDAYNKALANKK